ncbi:MAG: hypothetical protein PWR13_1261 [Archaeoglobi archaeon]|nr:hypothetical protein [Archaeoglobi archaeon]MDK2782233.1 hypothetical protein [Archaeoglobi archaeon]
MKNLKNEFERAVEMELKNAESLENSVRDLKNPLVKELVESIALDSKKHASVFSAILEHIENPLVPVSEEEYRRLEETIREHIKIEEEMKGFLEKIRGQVTDKRVDFLLKSVLIDEYRHHELLKELLQLVVRKELVTEDEWENLTWNIMLDGV